MNRKNIFVCVLLWALFGGIGTVVAHHIVPERIVAGMVLGSIIGVTVFALWLLHQWRACRGDGSCGNCPRRNAPNALEHYCGNHPRIRRSLRVCWLILLGLLTSVWFAFGHVLGGVLTIIVKETWEHASSLVGRLFK